MSKTPTQPNYAELEKSLHKSLSSFHPAQVHGLMCGYICAAPDTNHYPWGELVLGPKKNSAILKVIENIFENTYQQLNEFSLEFNLLLPADTIDINIRTESLGLWCQGFVIGLQQSETIQTNSFSAEVADTLKDLTEIAKIDFGDITDTEEDETAYFELVEYVRLAALMIFHELRQSDTTEFPEKNHILH